MPQYQCSFAITFLFPGLNNFPQTFQKSFLFSSTLDNRGLRKAEVGNLLNYWSSIICSFRQPHHLSISDIPVRSGLVQEWEQLINNLKPLLSPSIGAIEWFIELFCFRLSLIESDVETLRRDRKELVFIFYTY